MELEMELDNSELEDTRSGKTVERRDELDQAVIEQLLRVSRHYFDLD